MLNSFGDNYSNFWKTVLYVCCKFLIFSKYVSLHIWLIVHGLKLEKKTKSIICDSKFRKFSRKFENFSRKKN